MCGIVAVSGAVSAAREVFFGLLNLQHRGQDGAGILAVDAARPGGFYLQRASGLVDNAFGERGLRRLTGSSAIGHTRYATVGHDDPNVLQPFLDFPAGLGLAHNGNLVNYCDLRARLGGEVGSDSHLMLRLLAGHMKGREATPENLLGAIGKMSEQVVGSYSVVGLARNGLIFGFRDPYGIRPLVLGTREGEAALASESVALDFLGYNSLSEVRPGEAVFLDPSGQVQRHSYARSQPHPCQFEWVYFARVESTLEGTAVYDARFRLGLALAKRVEQLGIEADVVVPVPETSRIAAVALSEALDIPFRELLIKNRYVNRTFILDDQPSRREAVRRKLFPIASEFAGKRCLIVDDSIVRGNTAAQIIRMVRQAGAREVIILSSCPPISYPCYYGIDFPVPGELVAHDRTAEEVALELGADRVVYQTLESLQEALGQPSLCLGCLTGRYPTSTEAGRQFSEQRARDRATTR